jgi:hypothetical protein
MYRQPPCGEIGHVQRYCSRDRSDHGAKVAEEVLSDSDGDGVFATGSDLPPMDKWLMDSGASSHMTSQREFLTGYRTFEVPEKVGWMLSPCS